FRRAARFIAAGTLRRGEERIMEKILRTRRVAAIGPMLVMWVLCTGCQHACVCVPPDIPVPRELDKVTLPTYTIEPPDVVIRDGLRAVPRPPYLIQPLDQLVIKATNTLPEEPIDGVFVVEPEGTVSLGGSYGVVKVVDLTKAQAQ